MNEPLRKPDPGSLESRVAALEESLNRVNAFNGEVTKALQHVLEQLRELVVLPERTKNIQKKFEDYRSVETLTRASKIFPKTRSVVFVSKGYFGDNVKYAYLAFCEHARARDIAVHFLADDQPQRDLLKDAGLPCLSATPEDWSLEDIRALFGAKVVVLGDNFHWQSFKSPKAYGMLAGAKTVQMWHGIPIKEIGLRYILRGDNVILDELLASAGEYDVFAAPCAAARAEWAQRFAFRDFVATGYPRTDVFFREPTPRDLLNVDRQMLAQFEEVRRNGQPAIIYTPTYRDDEASSWFARAGIDRFVEHARGKGYAFAVNLHPYEQVLMDQWRAKYPNIRFIAPGTDIYPLVRSSDILITDYSSLAFDYLLLDRPLIFYRPAGDKVVVPARGFIPTLVNETPGALATDVHELIAVADITAGFVRAPDTDRYRGARRNLRTKLFDYVDGNAAQRLCALIMKQIDG
jgi:CDP-glycerol glycerophosphotransferase